MHFFHLYMGSFLLPGISGLWNGKALSLREGNHSTVYGTSGNRKNHGGQYSGSRILFFDEDDSLFGRRSEVKEAKDRFANLEISYLLQRIEEYEGILILASNFQGDMDPAFLRRIRHVVRFEMPGEAV